MPTRSRRPSIPAALVAAVVVAGVGVATASAPVPAGAEPTVDEVVATSFEPDGFHALFDPRHLPGLAPIGPVPSITGDEALDDRIRSIAEARGYRRQPLPSVELGSADGVLVQVPVVGAWEALEADATEAGYDLQLRSGYRSEGDQRVLFVAKLGDTSDEGIDRRLTTAAAPGYSRHHTGFAIDITQTGTSVFGFRLTPSYEWLAADNFANAKRHGFVPSYPEGGVGQGPDPEPWELVWVGRDNIVCGDFAPVDGRTFCDTAGRRQLADIEWLHETGITTGCEPDRYCVDRSITRAEFVTMLWRFLCSPPGAGGAGGPSPFVDLEAGRYYGQAVEWAWADGVTTGIDPTRFGPDLDVSRAEAVTFLWRVVGRPAAAVDAPFEDARAGAFYIGALEWSHDVGVIRGATPTTFEPDRGLTRGEAASVLHRLDQTGLIDRRACA